MELLSYLANVTARSLCLASVALAGVWVFRVKTAAARHAALTVVTGGMLVLAALTATLPSISLRVLRAERAAPASPAQIDWLESLPSANITASHPSRERQRAVAQQPTWLPRFTWPALASAAYVSVAVLLLLRLAYGFLFTRRLVRATCVIEAGRPGGPPHYESSWISVPMTVGWLRPKILLPAAWKAWEARKLEAVLAHERMHIRRADWAIALLAAFNRSVFWFNPLAWWMEQRLALLAEQACDDAAVLETGAREPYAEALLDMAAAVRTGRGRMVWEAMAMARTAEVRKRIERILDETRQIPRGLTRGRWAALMACSLPLMIVTSVVRLAPAQDIRPPAQGDFARPALSPEPQAPPMALAQALPAPVGAAAAGMGGRGGASLTPPSPARPGEIKYKDKRLLVLYFDFQGMTTDDQIRVQNNAQTFIASQMTAGDLAAIMTYTGELKVVQDFTDDRDVLSRVVRNLPVSGGQASGVSGATDAEFDLYMADRQLASLEAAVKMLATLPEKKSLIYFGSGISRNGIGNDAQLRATIDAALRANVAFYPVDASGLPGAAFFQSVITASAQPPNPYIVPMEALPIHQADPVYAPEARGPGVAGAVQFRIIVGTDGHVRDAQLIGGPPLLQAAAREAVNQYLYSPFRMANGELAEFETTVSVPFWLNGASPSQSAIEKMRILTRNYQAEYGRNAGDSTGDHAPQLLRKVQPEYPLALRSQNIQGIVTLAFAVGADGVPKDIRVTQSADPGLNAQALAAASQWRFTPARKDGQPVEAPAAIQMTFRLQ